MKNARRFAAGGRKRRRQGNREKVLPRPRPVRKSPCGAKLRALGRRPFWLFRRCLRHSLLSGKNGRGAGVNKTNGPRGERSQQPD